MGCDIHLHVEIKLNGKWEHYSCPWITRNYSLFSKLADVRNDPKDYITPISKPRGLPYDVSFVTKFDYKHWGCDAHSASYITAKEITEVEKWAGEQLDPPRNSLWGKWNWDDALSGTFLFGNSFADFPTVPDDYPKDLEDVRFVFWFDN